MKSIFVLSFLLTSLLPVYAYQVSWPRADKPVSGTFNFIARKDSQGTRPAAITVYNDAAATAAVFTADTWFDVEEWWQLSVPYGILPSGKFYWKFEDDTNLYTFDYTADFSPSARDGIFYDNVTLGADNQRYSLSNLWVRKADEEQPFTIGYNLGRVGYGCFRVGDKYYLPVLDLGTKDDAGDLRELDHRFDVINANTGAFEGQKEFTMNHGLSDKFTTLYNRRRIEEAGTDDAGNAWVVSAYNPQHNEYINVPNNPYQYYADEDYRTLVLEESTKKERYIIIYALNFDDPESPKVNHLYKALLPSTDEWKTLLQRKYDYTVLNNLMKIATFANVSLKGNVESGKFRLTASFYPRGVQGDLGLHLVEWTFDLAEPKNFASAQGKFVSCDFDSPLTGMMANTEATDGTHYWINTADYGTDNNAATIQKPPRFCVKSYDGTMINEVFSLADNEIDYPSFHQFAVDHNYCRYISSGNGLKTFSLGGHNFIVHSLLIHPNIIFALRHLTTDTPASANEVPLLWKFPTENAGFNNYFLNTRIRYNALTNIYVSHPQQDVADIMVTVPQQKYMDSDKTTAPVIMAAYRMSRVLATGVENISLPEATASLIKVNGRTISLTNPDGQINVSITAAHGSLQQAFTLSADCPSLTLDALQPGIYICTARSSGNRQTVKVMLQ